MISKRLFFFCLFLNWCGSILAQTPVWTQMPGSPANLTRHDDIVFVNETTGWSARGRGGIFKTTDAGNTWTQVNSNSTAHFRCIGFVSESRGFAGNLGVGSYDGNVSDTNVLYQTTNGGVNWTVVPGLSESGMKGFCAMYVLDSQHIYGGGRVRGPAHFVKSENGGTNWTVVDMGTNGLNIMGGIMDVYFKDPLNGFVVGMDTNPFTSTNYHGRIAKTSDGGATWTPLATTTIVSNYFWKMSWPTPQVGYVSLQQNASASATHLIFYKTVDGGDSWVSNGVPYSAIGIPSFSLLQGIGFVSTNEGWVGGPGGSSANNFLHTIDGGATWMPAGYGDSQQINRIRFYQNFGVAAGSKLHIFRVPPSIAPSISSQPKSQTVGLGANAAFTVGASGSAPLNYQWRFNGADIAGETKSSFVRADVQPDDAGNYSVVVTNSAGSVTSAVATLTVLLQNGLLFQDNFDDYSSPSVITNAAETNGYKILFGAATGGQDFKAVFGFDYTTVTFPIPIPPAPNSSGASKGLFLSVNKGDATAAAAAVNLYPISLSASNDFSLKFDLWLNWTNLGSATEHALFGINHSGNVTNRVDQLGSDGLFFAMSGDGNVSGTAATIRDYATFRGSGNGVPFLMLTNNTSFGPTPPLGPRFDNLDPGFANLFPAKPIPGYPNTPAGSPGLSWVACEVRRENSLITCLLNGVVIAQYTNTFDYTNGNVMIGYNDTFSSTGNTNNFVLFDNIRVERIFPPPIILHSPRIVGSDFRFSFASEPNGNYTIEQATSLTPPDWTTVTNLVGDSGDLDVIIPLTNTALPSYFRVLQP